MREKVADRAYASEFKVACLANGVHLLFKREGLVKDNTEIAHRAGR